jgi:hypothetical protein
MGGQLGRMIPLINDVAESAALLGALAALEESEGPIQQLVSCSLPAELSELMRLSLGPPPSARAHVADTSLLAYYRQPGHAPDPLAVLEHLEAVIDPMTRESLKDWRDRVGSHTDEDTPWDELESGIEAVDLSGCLWLLERITLSLEHAACTPGGPVLLLLSSRRDLGGRRRAAERRGVRS